jgi:hypothetical protein
VIRAVSERRTHTHCAIFTTWPALDPSTAPVEGTVAKSFTPPAIAVHDLVAADPVPMPTQSGLISRARARP